MHNHRENRLKQVSEDLITMLDAQITGIYTTIYNTDNLPQTHLEKIQQNPVLESSSSAFARYLLRLTSHLIWPIVRLGLLSLIPFGMVGLFLHPGVLATLGAAGTGLAVMGVLLSFCCMMIALFEIKNGYQQLAYIDSLLGLRATYSSKIQSLHASKLDIKRLSLQETTSETVLPFLTTIFRSALTASHNSQQQTPQKWTKVRINQFVQLLARLFNPAPTATQQWTKIRIEQLLKTTQGKILSLLCELIHNPDTELQDMGLSSAGMSQHFNEAWLGKLGLSAQFSDLSFRPNLPLMENLIRQYSRLNSRAPGDLPPLDEVHRLPYQLPRNECLDHSKMEEIYNQVVGHSRSHADTPLTQLLRLWLDRGDYGYTKPDGLSFAEADEQHTKVLDRIGQQLKTLADGLPDEHPWKQALIPAISMGGYPAYLRDLSHPPQSGPGCPSTHISANALCGPKPRQASPTPPTLPPHVPPTSPSP